MKTHVVSTFFRRPWGKGFRNISHTYGPYTKEEAEKVKKRMLRDNKRLIEQLRNRKGYIIYFSVEPMRNEENEYGAAL
jgi:hypothetical protein